MDISSCKTIFSDGKDAYASQSGPSIATSGGNITLTTGSDVWIVRSEGPAVAVASSVDVARVESALALQVLVGLEYTRSS